MLQSRPSNIPGRKHKTIAVDFSNPFLRAFFAGYPKAHEARLNEAARSLPGWVDTSRVQERADAAAAGRAPRPLAIVCDIDEVILSNIHMNSFYAPAGAQGPDAVDFHAADAFGWPRGARLNPLLPGAFDLLACARRLGLAVFFVTGRLEPIREETVENLVQVGLAGDSDEKVLRTADLLRPDGPLLMCTETLYPKLGESIRPFKEGRRQSIEKNHRIVLNLGDQVSDLGLFGDVQVLVPHPFYYIL